jgi:hypothetical protein
MSTATAELKLQTPEKTSLDHVQIQIGGNKPGAPSFRMHLLMNGSVATGIGRISQATNPPLDINAQLAGRTSLIVFGADVTRSIQLTGREIPGLLPDPINVRNCDIVLQGAEGKHGSASYEYLQNGQWHKVEGPATASWSTGNF